MTTDELAAIEAALKAATVDWLPGYEIEADGSVWSLSNWRGYGRRRLATELDRDGYPRAHVKHNGRMRRLMVHRLVAEAFIGPKPVGQEVRHLNGDKLDASARNLAYGTRQENADDRDRHGRTARGSRNGAARLSGSAAAEIRSLYAAGGITQEQLGRRFGVHQKTICRVLRSETWSEKP